MFQFFTDFSLKGSQPRNRDSQTKTILLKVDSHEELKNGHLKS